MRGIMATQLSPHPFMFFTAVISFVSFRFTRISTGSHKWDASLMTFPTDRRSMPRSRAVLIVVSFLLFCMCSTTRAVPVKLLSFIPQTESQLGEDQCGSALWRPAANAGKGGCSTTDGAKIGAAQMLLAVKHVRCHLTTTRYRPPSRSRSRAQKLCYSVLVSRVLVFCCSVLYSCSRRTRADQA